MKFVWYCSAHWFENNKLGLGRIDNQFVSFTKVFDTLKLAVRLSATTESHESAAASVVSSANCNVAEMQCRGSLLIKILNSNGLRPEP